MEDFNSKYTGEQVEALLDIVSQGGVGGGGGEGEVQKTTETEILAMGFTKNQGTITEVKMNGVSKGTSGIVDLGTVITEHQDISGKQDSIEDLDDIRAGASKGATALQSIPSEYVTENELNNRGYATTTALNDKVDKVSGKGLSTNDFTTALKTKLEGLSNYDDTAINSAVSTLRSDFDKLVSGDSTTAIKTFNEIIAFLDGIADSESLDSIISSIEQQIAGKQATISDLATIRSGAALGATALQSYTEKYTGTITGITMNGVSKGTSGVVNLGNVITEHQDISGKQDKLVSGTNIKTINNTSILGSGNISITGGSGTITGVSANGTSIATSGVANIPAASTSQYGVTKLSSATNSTSTTLAATASAVKSAYDLANRKQDKLVSGTNIKTINGTSILGSGNITISGGGGGTSGGGKEFVEIEPDFAPDGYYGVFSDSIPLQPNKVYVFTEALVNLSVHNIETSWEIGDEYTIMFTAGSSSISISISTIDSTVYWANGAIPPISEGDLCELSLVRIGSNYKAVLTTFKPVD